MLKNPKADFYFSKPGIWQSALVLLRTILGDSLLQEELKWGVPCYTLGKKNILLLHVFKDYCAMLFFKGALLKDPLNLLIQQTDNTQATRQLRFQRLKEIHEKRDIIQSYILEAIEIEKAGLKVPLKETSDFNIPDELQNIFSETPAFKKAFYLLTQGRQRGYLLFFSAPKQSKTRTARIEKCKAKILLGKGLND